MANKKEYDENRKDETGSEETLDGEAIIRGLESEQEILRYRSIFPVNEPTDKLVFIIQEIRRGIEISDTDSDFLDSIDSRFIGHLNNRKMSKRESLCYFLDQYWDWTSLNLPKIRNVSVNLQGMYTEYTAFCKDKKIKKKNIMKYREMKEYLSKYAEIKRYQGVDKDGKKSNTTSAVGMPLYRNLDNVPPFDVSKVLI